MNEAKYIYTELDENSNKFWNAVCDGITVTTTWGRVGEPGQSKAKTFGDSYEAEKFFASKCREKERKGYTLQQTLGGAKSAPVGNLATIAKAQIQHNGDSETAKLIDFLVKRNIHAIEGATQIKYNAQTGQFTTPLGPVTTEGLDKADRILADMVTYVEAKRYMAPEFTSLVNKYMRIIPQNIGRKRVSGAELFGSTSLLQQQKTLIDTLRTVVKDADAKAVSDAPEVFKTALTLVADTDPEFKRIAAKFEKTANANHRSSYGMKLKKVWKVEIAGSAAAFDADGAKLGAHMELWHGTKDANLLSILKGGYVIPGRSSSMQITGRMFGDGIYFSDQSTKSLNYATGGWGNGRSNRCFMLLNTVAMGKGFEPTGSFSGGCKPGFDSTFAKPRKSGVINNEMIVYRTSQIRPEYLCEFE